VQLSAVRLRQEHQRHEREHVAEHAERDRAAQPDRLCEEADDPGEQGADATADVVTERSNASSV
jgi:hypothetical protein